MLAQAAYKLIFLGTAVLPLALRGEWSAIPVGHTSAFAIYLLLLAACAPWRYLLGAGDWEGGAASAGGMKSD